MHENFPYDLKKIDDEFDFNYSKSVKIQKNLEILNILTDENIELEKVEYKLLDLANEEKDIIENLKSEIVSIDDMKSRYATIVKIFKLNKIDWRQPIVQLPNLSLKDIDDRYFAYDSTNYLINMINRSEGGVDSYVEYIQKNNSPLYIYGLKGIGKTFVLYQMAAKFMIMDNKYRVIYINQTNFHVILKTLEILKAIIKYDCETNTKFESEFRSFCSCDGANELCKFMNSKVINQDSYYVTKLISQVKHIYWEFKIHLIFIFDQINILFDHLASSKLNEEEIFLKKISQSFKTVFSATANNEPWKLDIHLLYHPGITDLENIKGTPPPILPIKFTKEEIKIMLSFYSNAKNFIKTNCDLEYIDSITGGVPLELHIFFNNKKATNFNQMIRDYYNNFFDSQNDKRYCTDSVAKWFYKQDEMHQNLAKINLAKCILKTTIINNTNSNIYDRRLFVFRRTDNGDNYIEPFSGFAMEAIMSFYNKYLQEHLINEFRTIVNSNNYTNSMIDDCIRIFIIQLLCIRAANNEKDSVDFEVIAYGKNEQPSLFQMNNYQVIYFFNEKTPRESFGFTKNLLFVPLTSNYSGFDLFYYNHKEKKFYCIQITAHKQPLERVIKNDDQVNEYDTDGNVKNFRPRSKLSVQINGWINYLPEQTKFIEIWILSQKYFETQLNKNRNIDKRIFKRANQMNVIYFETMKTPFELIASYFQK